MDSNNQSNMIHNVSSFSLILLIKKLLESIVITNGKCSISILYIKSVHAQTSLLNPKV